MAKRLTASLVLAVLMFASVTAMAGYRSELRRATEKGSFFHFNNWDAELIWRATFFSDRFRKAFTKRHEELRYLSRPEVDRYVAEQEMRQADGWEFFVTVYTKKQYQKINNYEDTFWKIYLIPESGKRIKPTSVEQLPVTPYERKMFPHLDRWSKAYFVVFPKVDIGKKFELSLESVVGSSTLDFKVK